MKLLLDRYYKLLKIILTLLTAFMVVPVAIQIASRFIDFIPRYIWTEEAARFCFIWIIMIGATVAVREGTHFDVDLMPQSKTKRQEGISKLIAHLGMMLLAVIFTWYGFYFARFGSIQTSEMIGINMISIYISFPLAGVTWVLFLVEKIAADIRLISRKKSEPQL